MRGKPGEARARGRRARRAGTRPLRLDRCAPAHCARPPPAGLAGPASLVRPRLDWPQVGWERGVPAVVVFKKSFSPVSKPWVSTSPGFFFVSVASRRVERGLAPPLNSVFLLINENV